MDRFGVVAECEIDEIVKKNVPINTKRTHISIWRQFEKFCAEKKYKLNEECTLQTLSKILKDYAYNMKKENGEDYKEVVVKVMWNTTAKLLQELYFKDFNKKFDPFKDIEFKAARDARDAKRRELQMDPNKRKCSSSALDEKDYQKLVQVWDEDTPEGLQRKFYLIAAKELAWRGNEGTNCLTTYFHEVLDSNGQLTNRLEYNPIFTKTRQGGSGALADSKWLVFNENHPNLCPVRLYRKLLLNRGAHVTTERVFLTENPAWRKQNSIGWFKNLPKGINEMSKWMKVSAEKANLDVKRMKITNHSARSSAVTQLAKSGVAEQELIKITGHGSSASIRPYLQLDKSHHLKLIDSLRSGPSFQANAPAPTPTVITDSSWQNSNASSAVVYNNCTIYNNHYNDKKP